MGYQERDYFREDENADPWAIGNFSVTVKLILANVAVALLDLFFSTDTFRISSFLSTSADALIHPLDYWRFLTYGFVHDPQRVAHIVGNMFMLYIVGRDLEEHYGPREFFRFFLVALLVSGLGWAIAMAGPFLWSHKPIPPIHLLGASGGVMGAIVLFCLSFPRRPVKLFFHLPGWVAGVIWLAADLFGAMGRGAGGAKIAYEAHAAGALFGLAYFYLGFRFGSIPGWRECKQFVLRLRGKQPRLRIRTLTADDEAEDFDDQLDQRADSILAKLHEKGDASLTREERRILEEYSRRMRSRRS